MHFFVQLCRQNNQSENSKVFSAFKSPVKTFDNIFGNLFFFFSRITTVLLNFKMLHSNRKCAKWVEISGCKMVWTCSVGYSLVINVHKDASFGLILTLFKICNQFSKFAIFGKIVKIPFLKRYQLFLMLFQCGAPSCSLAHNEFVEN